MPLATTSFRPKFASAGTFAALFLALTSNVLHAEPPPPPRPICEVYANNICPTPAELYMTRQIACPGAGFGKICTPALPAAIVNCYQKSAGGVYCEASPQPVDNQLHYTWSSGNGFFPDGADAPIQQFACVTNSGTAIKVVVSDNYGRSTQAEIDVLCRIGDLNEFGDPVDPDPIIPVSS
jgi:hypothetical protein